MQSELVEQKAIQTYQDNLLFLQETEPSLFQKINSLTHAIDQNYYKEKYSLEYKNEYFDVLEVKSNKFLYGENSNVYAKIASDSIDYSKIDNLFETFYNVVLDKDYAKELESKNISDYSYASAASLISYSNQFADKKDTTMIKLYKFIFFGTGLGQHLESIHKKIKSNVYLIIEDDLELFRLSLFVTNYRSLTDDGAKVFFSVLDDEAEFNNTIKQFFYEQFIYNHYIKFFHMLSHSDEKIKLFQNHIVGQTYLTFNHSALMTSLLRPLEHLKSGYRLLDISSSYENTVFEKKPVLLLGAGPSFGNNLEWLKENCHKFIIVAVSALMSKLEEMKIKPDIITHVHGFADALPHIQKVKDMAFFDNTISLFGGMSYPQFVDYFQKDNVFIFEGSSRYKRDFGGITSSNIGALSYGLLLMLHTKEMFTLGLDFAPNQESGQTHTQTHAHTRKIELKKNENLGGGIEYQNEVIEVKGNLKDTVFTSLIFNGMKEECNAISRTYKTNENFIYNLSQGVLLDDAKPMKLDDKKIKSLKKLNKDKIYKDLKQLFKSKSQDFLTKEEIEDINIRIQYCDLIIDTLQKHLSTAQPNLNQYHYNLLGTFYNILTDDNKDFASSDMNYIITLYLQFVSGYIFDLINTKEISSEKKLIKHLDKITIPQIIRVVTFFRDKLSEFNS